MAKYAIDFDFVAIPLALFASGLDATALAAYAGLRALTRYQQTDITITDEDAGRAGGMSARAFRDARTRLREAGWLSWQRTGRGNQYTVLSMAYGKTEIRSADSADQSGKPLPSVRQNPPLATTGENTNKEQDRPAPAQPVPDTPAFALGPYIDQHEALLGGRAPSSLMGPVFQRLEERVRSKNPGEPVERIQRTVLHHQRRYLESVKAGGGQYLSYAKFEQTFGTWSKGNPARPLATLGEHKDFADGMSDLDRKRQAG